MLIYVRKASDSHLYIIPTKLAVSFKLFTMPFCFYIPCMELYIYAGQKKIGVFYIKGNFWRSIYGSSDQFRPISFSWSILHKFSLPMVVFIYVASCGIILSINTNLEIRAEFACFQLKKGSITCLLTHFCAFLALIN